MNPGAMHGKRKQDKTLQHEAKRLYKKSFRNELFYEQDRGEDAMNIVDERLDIAQKREKMSASNSCGMDWPST